jgi:hypothetical protein
MMQLLEVVGFETLINFTLVSCINSFWEGPEGNNESSVAKEQAGNKFISLKLVN